MLFCFNTQPPEGGWTRKQRVRARHIGFNTQPPEGGWAAAAKAQMTEAGFNTQPPEGGWSTILQRLRMYCLFQHTAARRRLGRQLAEALPVMIVSTHSRPKAAGI